MITGITTFFIFFKGFSNDRSREIRIYNSFAQELIRIFEFIDPHKNNDNAFSIRLQSLLINIGCEFENHMRCILSSNNYKESQHYDIKDYNKIIEVLSLSEYKVSLMCNEAYQFKPLARENGKTPWYHDYTLLKHNRNEHFTKATLKNTLYGLGALYCSLFAQYGSDGFSDNTIIPTYLGEEDRNGICILHPFIIYPVYPQNIEYNFPKDTDGFSSLAETTLISS